MQLYVNCQEIIDRYFTAPIFMHVTAGSIVIKDDISEKKMDYECFVKLIH